MSFSVNHNERRCGVEYINAKRISRMNDGIRRIRNND